MSGPVNATHSMPRPLAPFMAFAQALRASGFAVAPEQTRALIAATGLLGPRSLMDIRRAAHATLGPPPERREEFNALFDEAFLGQTLTAEAFGEPEDMPAAYDAGEFELMQGQGCRDLRGCHLVPGAGHWVQQEQAGAVVGLIRDFLRAG